MNKEPICKPIVGVSQIGTGLMESLCRMWIRVLLNGISDAYLKILKYRTLTTQKTQLLHWDQQS